jgi:hypothetical protein
MVTCCLTGRSLATQDQAPFAFGGFVFVVLVISGVIAWQVLVHSSRLNIRRTSCLANPVCTPLLSQMTNDSREIVTSETDD